MSPMDTPVAAMASPHVSISAYRQVAELERNATDAALRIKELEAMVRDLREKEMDHLSTISQLESSLVKAGNLQQDTVKDCDAKERDFAETVGHLERKVAQAMAEMQQKEQDFNDHITWLEEKARASPGKSDLKSELAVSKQKIASLEKDLAQQQAIVGCLLEEAAKKDQDQKRELDRLRQELQPQSGSPQERPPRQGQASPIAQRLQDPLPPRALSPVAGAAPSLPSRQGSRPDNASLQRACESVAKLESEMQKFREQFKSRDQQLRDLQARFESPSRSPERRRSPSKARTSVSRRGDRSASPDAFGDPVVAEWRMHLDRFNPSTSGELLQVQFQRLTELEAEVMARVQQRPELVPAVQAVLQEKCSKMSSVYQAVGAQRRRGLAPSLHAATTQREAAHSSSTPNRAASVPQGCASAVVDASVTVSHVAPPVAAAASVPAGMGVSRLPGCAAGVGGSASSGSLSLPPRGGMLLSAAPPRVQAGEPQSLRSSLDSQSLRGSLPAAALRRDVQELRSRCSQGTSPQILQGSSLQVAPGAQQSTAYSYKGVMTARPTLAASPAMPAVQEMVNPVLLSHQRPAARSLSPPALHHNSQHWH